MNEFEKKMNALRSQYKAEQRQITKDSLLAIGHLNTDIGQVTTVEARIALRAEKQRLKERMRQTHEINRTCYFQQLELIIDEMSRHYSERSSQ